MMAGAPRRSRSYVLASLRALHLDLRLVASKTGASRGKPPLQDRLPGCLRVGPELVDIEGVRFGVGPSLAAMMGPTQDALTSKGIAVVTPG